MGASASAPLGVSSVAPVPRTARYVALAVVLVAQLAMFVVFVPKPPVVVSDNARYETAGYLLATGKGLSLPYALAPDIDTRAWACTRSPQACTGDIAPSAMYAPGYSIYIALLYYVFGRSLWAVVLSQLALLLLTWIAFEAIAAKYLGRSAGYAFVMAVAATYPFLARQAGAVMSDHLHAVLVLIGLAALLLRPPGLMRGLAAGACLAAATLTRPYSVVCLPFVLVLVYLDTRCSVPRRRARLDLGGLAAGMFVPMAAWTFRNAIVFGHFIPLTTSGLGAALYLNKLQWTVGSAYNASHATRIYEQLNDVAQGDFNTWRGNRLLTSAAAAWMEAHPGRVILSLIPRVPRVWVSLGTSGGGVSRAWPLLVGYLGGLLVLGVDGMWSARSDRRLRVVALFIVLYWAFLLHTPAEARRSLPLRLPLLLFAGLSVTGFAGRRMAKPVAAWIERVYCRFDRYPDAGEPAAETV